MTQGVTIPLLQDSLPSNVMYNYAINHNDIVVLDSSGRVWKQVGTTYLGVGLLQESGRDSVTRWVREAP